MPRFVTLLHEMPQEAQRPTHWDFMLEQDGRLRTWALAEPPKAGKDIAAEELPEHRLAYLDYEGPVSGNRGAVTRWDEGQYELANESEDALEVQLEGRRIQGKVLLTRHVPGSPHWRFRLESE